MPESRTAKGMLYVALGPSIRLRNQSLRWAKESGTFSGRSARRSGARSAVEVSPSSVARVSAVGFSKTRRIGSSTPSTARTRPTSRVASSEWPPSSKKLSLTATDSRPSTSANSPHSSSSCGVLGFLASSVACSGAGSAFWSTFPLVVSGRVSSAMIGRGTM